MKANGTFSELQKILTGVPQGFILEPLSFIMFINDLTLNENCYLFADACLLITHGKTHGLFISILIIVASYNQRSFFLLFALNMLLKIALYISLL